MKRFNSLTLAGILFALAGCTSSLNPIFTSEELVFDRNLIGVWTDPEGNESWSFSYCGDKEYKLVYIDEHNKRGEFHARLVRLGDGTFLDLTPVTKGIPHNDFYKGHLLAIHSFIKVSRAGDQYQISYLEPEWLSSHLAKNPGAVRHAVVGSEVVLTDSTKNLQKFLAEHIKSPGAFSEPVSVRRKEALK